MASQKELDQASARGIKKVSAQLQGLPVLIKYLLVATTIIFISFLFPNNARFQYEYQKDQSWRYDDLYAPFDFPIRKTEAEIKEERSKVESDFSPVYRKDSSIKPRQRQQFVAAFEVQKGIAASDPTLQHFQSNSEIYKSVGLRLINELFDHGIIRLDSLHLGQSERFVVRINDEGTLTPFTLQSLYEVGSAIEVLRNDLVETRLPDISVLLPIIEPLIIPNILYDREFSETALKRTYDQLVTSKGIVKKAELMINRDGIVTDEIYQKLNSFRLQYEQEISRDKSYWGVFFGYLLLSLIMIGIYLLFLKFNAKEIYGRFMSLLFLLLWIMVFAYLVYLIDPVDALSTYVIPFCIVPIVLKNFFNERVALFTHLIIVLIASFLTSLGYEFTFLTLLAGIVATLSITETRDWGQFFKSIAFIFLTYSFGFIGLSLIRDGSIVNVEYSTILWLLVNAVLVMLSYPLIPLLGRIFGYTSSISLIELSDLNRPLLKELSLKAPGTMQHSLQVAHLSEAAADRIGANALLVKVGALYHDIGKTRQPHFFTENQQDGTNPHETLNNEIESAKVIIDHVIEGAKMAVKNRLPQEFIDFILTHHGTTKTEFFYRNYVKKHESEEVDPLPFTYPGPKPHTKEEAIMMLADSIEAACKSLKSPTQDDIKNLVDKIVQYKIDQGQMSECALTFSEIEACKEVFVKMLISIYQPRIEYPDAPSA